MSPDPSSAVRSSYTRLAGNYDRRWPRYIAATTRDTLRRVQIHPSDRLLDIGCGTGAFLAAVRRTVPTARVIGIDLVPAMLAVARQKTGADVSLGAADAEALPFRSSSFDVVVSSSSFHYWPHPRLSLSEIVRAP